MLSFFQKYQKAFFILVTFLIIASFTFTGVFDTYMSYETSAKDRKVAENIDGTPVMFSTLQHLTRFISTDRMDMDRGVIPNLCNDGVIRNDLLANGIAELIVDEYFEELQEDLATRLERAKNYRGYENPEAPYISASVAWEQFVPAITKEWEALKSQSLVSPETFSHLSNLYQQQAMCPPEFIRRVLTQYTKQASWLKPDPYLQYADMSIFGFHTVSDWFGANFVDLSAQFILNVAKYAEIKGYTVTYEEAKASIVHNFQESLEKIGKGTLTLQDHLRSLGLDEKSAVEAWRSVLLFRRYFQEVGNATFVDHLPYRDFAAFSKEEFVIQKYEWPESLHLKTGQDFIDFQVYLNAISGFSNSLTLPNTVLSVEKIAESFPLLVHTSFRMNIASISIDEIGLRAPLKAVLDWQLESNNWDLLVYTFPFLEKANTNEDRFRAIENLTTANRVKIDQFARREWAKKQGDLIAKMLQEAPSIEKTVSIAKDWISVSEIENPRELAALIESAATGDCLVHEILERYSDQGKTFYRFTNLEKERDAHVLTFQEAKDLGVMSLVSDHFLETEYKKIRSKHPTLFQVKDGEWKHYSTVKEEIAKIIFSDLLKKIGKEKETLANYATHRLEKQACDARAALLKNPENAAWLCQQDKPDVLNQFKLVKKTNLIQRTTKDEWMKEQVFTMNPNEWSPVYVPADGNISFFFFEKRQASSDPILEQITLGQEVIAADAQRFVAKTMLSKSRLKIPTKEQ
ncbi:MAG TPA: hypothetical protein VLE96_01475 [Chlamydiales bacterium]|nr:hypothetical protein [Chlamydiales bacterium]